MIDDALTAFLAGVAACDGTPLVKAKVRSGALDDWFGDLEHPTPIHVLAVGKAAPSMVWGLKESSVPFSGLGICPQGTRRSEVGNFVWLEGEHPVPGKLSLAAGEAVLDWLRHLPPGPLLVLLSGGASSVMEVFAEGSSDTWRSDMEQGLDIETLNQRRALGSRIKGGGLAVAAGTRDVRVWCIADVPPEVSGPVVGSGPFWNGEIQHEVLASAENLLEHAAHTMQSLGWSVRTGARLTGDTETAAATFAKTKLSPGEAYVLAGETTVISPGQAPGGRCQHAALVASQFLEDRLFVALASDGVDGSTKEAGAWSDGATWTPKAAPAIEGRTAHAFLDGRDQTLRTGRLPTNVNDLWVLMRPLHPR